MKSAHNSCLIALLLPFFIATCSLAASAEPGIVNTRSGLSLRATPATSGKLLQKLPHGTRIEILDKNGPAAQIEGLNGNWFKIKNKNDTGWVFGGFIKAAENDQTNEARPANSLVQTVSAAAQNTDTDLADSEAASNGFDFVGREKQLLKKYSNKLSRRQKSLKLKCSGGKSVELINEEAESESYVMYFCIDYIAPEGLFLVYAQMYEGSDHFFVSESSAKTTSLGDMPIFSPGRSRVAVSGFDITAAYDYNGIKIFKINKGELQQEFEIQPEEWGPQNFHWESETSATFNQVKIVEGVEMPGKPSRLSFDQASGQWQIESGIK